MRKPQTRNNDIRAYAAEHGVRFWEIAEVLGFSDSGQLSKLLRRELPEEKKQEIFSIIDEICKEG